MSFSKKNKYIDVIRFVNNLVKENNPSTIANSHTII